MIYSKITFSKREGRPFFYTSFVSTVDGKIWINKEGYWPIGSKTDYETFTYLRAHADTIIDGKNTALQFGKNTIDTICGSTFKVSRKKLGKINPLKYIVVTSHPDKQLEEVLKNPYNFKPEIFTKDSSELVQYLNQQDIENVFIDGGPTLLASFLNQGLLDEIFLTIAPKIYGNDGSAITMVEGQLFPPNKIKLQLLSAEKIEDEVSLRYKILS